MYRRILDLIATRRSFAVALVLKSEGSTPQKTGARAVIFETGEIEGTIGGGAVEAEARRRAVEACKTGRPVVFEMSFDGNDVENAAGLCGGAMRVLLDPTAAKDRAAYAQAAAALECRERGVLVTTVKTSGQIETKKISLADSACRVGLDPPRIGALTGNAGGSRPTLQVSALEAAPSSARRAYFGAAECETTVEWLEGGRALTPLPPLSGGQRNRPNPTHEALTPLPPLSGGQRNRPNPTKEALTLPPLSGGQRGRIFGADAVWACLTRETAAFISEDSSTPQISSGALIEPVIPQPMLLIAGGGHIGQALARQAVVLGFDVTVIDDRPEFSDPALFPDGATARCGDIRREIAKFPIGNDTYIVLVTRGHEHDARALEVCIRAPAAYIGMIGSARKVAKIREHFLATRLATEDEFDRVHAPIGLDIGAVSVPEIATSIAAELIAVRRKGARRSAVGEKALR